MPLLSTTKYSLQTQYITLWFDLQFSHVISSSDYGLQLPVRALNYITYYKEAAAGLTRNKVEFWSKTQFFRKTDY